MTISLQTKLALRSRLGNLRTLKMRSNLIDFASNDYLGLARSKDLQERCMRKWHAQELLGSTGSRLLTGNSNLAQELEEKIALFHDYPTALLFNCGYMANLGLLSSIPQEGDTVLFDARIHASMREGIRLGKARAFPFRHNDLNHLETRLKNNSGAHCFVCIESIYSTQGSIAPLRAIAALCSLYGALLIVDEAHSIGLYGPQGRGLVAQHQLTGQVFAQIVTFGKALGTHGAAVLGSTLLKDALINFAPSSIYTTALPFYALCAIESSYELLPDLDLERARLQQLISHYCSRMSRASQTHIQSVPMVASLAQLLLNAGFDVRPLLSPTVPRSEESLRICLHAFNTEEEIFELTETLNGALS